jgi:hypothetical protein
MANEEQLSILKQGVKAWNEWRASHQDAKINLRRANLRQFNLYKADLHEVNLYGANLQMSNLRRANLSKANLNQANLEGANLSKAALNYAELQRSELKRADLREASLLQSNLRGAYLKEANLRFANLSGVDLSGADVWQADLYGADLRNTKFHKALIGDTNFGHSDLSLTPGLEDTIHSGPSNLSIDIFFLSKGRIPEAFLQGCGLRDWEIATIKLYNPDLSNEEISDIQYKIYDLRAKQALQISPLFVSYSRVDDKFVDKMGHKLTQKGIRYWRDIHDMKAGRMEKQIDRAIRQNPTVLLVLSEHSLSSDWVEHEVRTARELEQDMGRDVLCPIALDDSWKSSPWPKRVMEQLMEYNILDFSAWQHDIKFDNMFRKLIDGLELFYKG